MVGGLTRDLFLGGRLEIMQPAEGFRAGMDSVMLPAAIAPENGLRVIDVGTGAGVGALCLLAREPRFRVTALEADPELAALARENARHNGLALEVLCRDLFGPRPEQRFEQVMTNPPYLDPARAQAPPDEGKARAHVEGSTIADWIGACFALLEPKGVLTAIYRTDRLPELLAALEERGGDIAIFPLWPGESRPSRRVIVRARKDSNAPSRLLSGLVLHAPGERYTRAAEAVLREAAPVDLG